MLFNTLIFAKFFVVVYITYRMVGRYLPRLHNLLLLVASYLFYASWDWRFVGLPIYLTLVNYFLGARIAQAAPESSKSRWVVLGVAANLAPLGFFKYFGWFAAGAGFSWGDIAIPLGISFVTFQAMSYTLDIGRGVIQPAKNFVDFACFVSFFPNLVAGPIERARNLLPQIQAPRRITRQMVCEGGWLFFFGLYKKIYVADNLARLTEKVFAAPSAHSGLEIVSQTFLFAIQLYMDFSGYSDMARGVARVMGFDIMANFRFPYFARNISDLWQRWHISLTTWIKEYLFYPLALQKFGGRLLPASVVIFVTWILMGAWHGPQFKFILWGVYHAVLLILYNRLKPRLQAIRPQGGAGLRAWPAAGTLLTFVLFSAGLWCFAAGSTAHLEAMLGQVVHHFAPAGQFSPALSGFLAFLILPVMVLEYAQYRKDDEFWVFRLPAGVRAAIYVAMFYSIIYFGVFSARQYYYYQF